MKRVILSLLFILGTEIHASVPTHLVLVGGGKYPAQAMAQFMEWAGGSRSHILIVSWATQNPAAALSRLSEALAPFHAASIEQAPSFEDMATKSDEFRNQLQRASGVFFTGGSQTRIMSVVQNGGFSPELRRRFASGVVFGGSSAGTAIMSEVMFTGKGDETRIQAGAVVTAAGLGFVTGAIVDTHFLKRRRENRLFSVLLCSRETVGLGIDEGTAISLSDNHLAKVLGPGPVMLVTRQVGTGDFKVSLKNPGENFELEPNG